MIGLEQVRRIAVARQVIIIREDVGRVDGERFALGLAVFKVCAVNTHAAS